MKRSSSPPVVVAAGQIQSRLMNEASATLQSIGETIREAARQEARLLVLPECAYPAYLLGSVDSYRTGEHLSSREFTDWLAARAAEHGLYIVSGFVEDTGESLFNAALLIGPDGRIIGRTRKRFLWNVDQDWFQPGEEITSFATEIGRIGIIICAEARVPEIIATLAVQGADLIAMPTCWINNARQPGEYCNPQVDFLIEARAREFGIPFVCADKSGMEMTVGYVGQSCVVTPAAGMMVKAPTVGEALVTAEITCRGAYHFRASESRRKRLLDDSLASLPTRPSPCALTIAAVSTALANRHLSDGGGESLFGALRDAGVRLLIANMPDQASAERLAVKARAFDMHAVGFPAWADLQTIGEARVGCMAGQWLGCFGAGRALSLDGAEILVYFDAADDLAMLRTRALENRVFVVGVDADAATIVGPDATVLARGTAEEPALAGVDLAEASDKQVARRTDIFAQRRTGMYRF